MKTSLALVVGGALALAGSVQASVIVGYTSGVSAVWGAAGSSANPTDAGWTYVKNVNNAYLGGFDSTNGGWRTVDATSTGYVYYQYALTPQDQTALADAGLWRLTYSAAIDRHAWTTGNVVGVNNYFVSTLSRQNNSGVWFEGPNFRYSLYFEVNADTNLVVYDQTSRFVIDGSAFETFRTFVIEGTNNAASLSVGSQSFTLTPAGIVSANRMLFGAFTGTGQGSEVWNSVTLEVIPEPGTISLLILFGVATLLRRGLRR